MKEFFLSSLWIGILLGFLLGTGIWWGFHPKRSDEDGNQDKSIEQKVATLEIQMDIVLRTIGQMNKDSKK